MERQRDRCKYKRCRRIVLQVQRERRRAQVLLTSGSTPSRDQSVPDPTGGIATLRLLQFIVSLVLCKHH